MTTRRRLLSLAASAAVLRRPGHAGQSPHFAVEEKIDHILEKLIEERSFPGAQFAVGREGRVLLSKGIGLADREQNLAVQPRTFFRIASISKPLTAVATLTLVEAGKLTLDTKMLDVLKVEPYLENGRKLDPRLKQITIRQLLQHTGGWNRDKSGDIMFQSKRISGTLGVTCPPSAREVIRDGLGRPLDFDPGSRYAYSNFGYCVLGRIIEDLTGGSYAGYVQKHVLDPAQIVGPRLGATSSQRVDEAHYYATDKDGKVAKADCIYSRQPQQVPVAYGAWCLEHMDSHGGWISSAEDMVRFGMSLDDIGKTSPFSQRKTFDLMLQPAPGSPGHDKNGRPLEQSYACGFGVLRGKSGLSFSHSGSLPGTLTFLMRRTDGWCWAVFLNQRPRPTDPKLTLFADIQKVFDGLALA